VDQILENQKKDEMDREMLKAERGSMGDFSLTSSTKFEKFELEQKQREDKMRVERAKLRSEKKRKMFLK